MFEFLVVSWAIILLYWFWFYLSVGRHVENLHSGKHGNVGVSVVVCYKNESKHIVQTIKAILNQKYPLFEVIAMNDFSTDGSNDLVGGIEDNRLRCYDVKEYKPGKKQAIEEAVRIARYPKLLFTDADCVPSSDNWINHMASGIDSEGKTEIVLGFAPLYTHKSFLSYFQRYETVLTAMQYISYAMSGIPYMGVGRNLMYTKQLFLNAGGMQDLMQTASGDDDLMVSKMSNQTKVRVVLDHASFVFSEGKKSWREYIRQKVRHISTAVHYKSYHKVLLTLFALSQIAFYVLLITVFVTNTNQTMSASILLITKWGGQQMLQKETLRKLQHQELQRYFPVLDITMTIYYMMMPFLSLFTHKTWK